MMLNILKQPYIYCMIMLGVSSLTKLYRNSYNYNSTQQGGIWNIISLLFIFIAFLYYLKNNKVKIPFAIKSALVYSAFSVFNCLIVESDMSVFDLYSILMIVFYPCVMLVFYYIGLSTNIVRRDKIITNILFVAMIMIVLLSLISLRTDRLDYIMVSNAYYPLCLLPLVIAVNNRNNLWRYIIIVFTFIVLLLSNKRTGTIAFLLFIFCFLLIKPRKTASLKIISNLFVLSIVGISLYFLYSYVLDSFDLNILQKLMNLSQDNGSGRSDIYISVWNAIKVSDFVDLFLGHGMHSVGNVLVIHDSAHNDFLQIFYEYGLLPIIVFILHYIALFAKFLQMYNNKYENAGIYIGGIFISLMMSLFSMYCIDFSYVICGAAFTGFLIGNYKKSLIV